MAHTYTYLNESLVRRTGLSNTADFVRLVQFIHDYNKLGLTPTTYASNATIVANYGTIATTLFNAARALSPTGTVPIKDKEKQVANDIQGYAQDLIERAETRKNTAEAELRRPVSPPSDARSLEDIDTELTDAESTLSDLNRRSIWTTIGIMAAAAVLFPPFLGWLAAGIAPSVVGTVVLGGGGALSIYNYNKNFKEGRQNSKKIINDNRKYRARIARARLELQRATTDYTQLVGDGMSIVGRFENVSNISNAYETKIQEDIADIESRIVRMESDAQNDWNTANGLIPADGTVGKGEYLARLTEGDDILKIENTPPSDNSFADLKKQFDALKASGETDITKYQAIEAKAIALQTKFNDLHLPDLLTASNPHNVTDRHNNIVTSIENSKNAFATRNLEIQELVNAGRQIGGQSAKDAFDATTNNYAAQYATASGGAASYRTAQLENIHADAVEREMTYRTDLVSAWNDYAKDSTAGVGLKAKVDSCSAMGPAEKSDYGAVVSSLGVLKTMIDSQNAILTSGTASDTDKQIARTLRSQALAKADVDIALARCYAKLASEPDATKQSDIKNAIADIKQIKTNMSLANTDPNFLTPEAASTNASARMATLESSLTTERIYNIPGLGLVKASQLRTMLDDYKDTIVPAAISADEGAWNALVGVSGAARGPLEAARTSTQTTLQTQREILEHLITEIKTEDPSFVTTDYDTKVTEAKTQENKANPELKVKDPVTGKEYTQSELETVIQDLFDSTKIGSVEELRAQADSMNRAAASMSGTAYITKVANRTSLITRTNGLRDQIEVAKRLISLCDSSYGTTWGATYGTKITDAENERDKVLPNKQFDLPIVGVMSEEDIAKEIETRLNALRTKIGDAQAAFSAYNSDYVAGRDTSSTKPAWEAIATTDSDSVKKQADELGKILQAYKSAGGTFYRSGADEPAVTTEIANAKKETAQVFEIDKSVGLIRPEHLDGVVTLAKGAISAKTCYSYDDVKSDPAKASDRQDSLNEYSKWIPVLEGVYNAKIGLGSNHLDSGMPELRVYIDGLKREIAKGMPSVASSEPKLKINGVLVEASDARDAINNLYKGITDASESESLDKEASAFGDVESASDSDREVKIKDRDKIANGLKANATTLEKYLDDYDNNGGDMSKLFVELGITDVSPIKQAISDAKQMSMPVHIHKNADGSVKAVYRMHEAFDEVKNDFPPSFTDKTIASTDPDEFDKLKKEVKLAETVISELKAIREEIKRTYGDSDSRIATMDSEILAYETTLANSKLTSARPSGEKTYTIEGSVITESVLKQAIENAYQVIATGSADMNSESSNLSTMQANASNKGVDSYKTAQADRTTAVGKINSSIQTLEKYLTAFASEPDTAVLVTIGGTDVTKGDIENAIKSAKAVACGVVEYEHIGLVRESEAFDELLKEYNNIAFDETDADTNHDKWITLKGQIEKAKYIKTEMESIINKMKANGEDTDDLENELVSLGIPILPNEPSTRVVVGETTYNLTEVQDKLQNVYDEIKDESNELIKNVTEAIKSYNALASGKTNISVLAGTSPEDIEKLKQKELAERKRDIEKAVKELKEKCDELEGLNNAFNAQIGTDDSLRGSAPTSEDVESVITTARNHTKIYLIEHVGYVSDEDLSETNLLVIEGDMSEAKEKLEKAREEFSEGKGSAEDVEKAWAELRKQKETMDSYIKALERKDPIINLDRYIDKVNEAQSLLDSPLVVESEAKIIVGKKSFTRAELVDTIKEHVGALVDATAKAKEERKKVEDTKYDAEDEHFKDAWAGIVEGKDGSPSIEERVRVLDELIRAYEGLDKEFKEANSIFGGSFNSWDVAKTAAEDEISKFKEKRVFVKEDEKFVSVAESAILAEMTQLREDLTGENGLASQMVEEMENSRKVEGSPVSPDQKDALVKRIQEKQARLQLLKDAFDKQNGTYPAELSKDEVQSTIEKAEMFSSVLGIDNYGMISKGEVEHINGIKEELSKNSTELLKAKISGEQEKIDEYKAKVELGIRLLYELKGVGFIDRGEAEKCIKSADEVLNAEVASNVAQEPKTPEQELKELENAVSDGIAVVIGAYSLDEAIKHVELENRKEELEADTTLSEAEKTTQLDKVEEEIADLEEKAKTRDNLKNKLEKDATELVAFAAEHSDMIDALEEGEKIDELLKTARKLADQDLKAIATNLVGMSKEDKEKNPSYQAIAVNRDADALLNTLLKVKDEIIEAIGEAGFVDLEMEITRIQVDAEGVSDSATLESIKVRLTACTAKVVEQIPGYKERVETLLKQLENIGIDLDKNKNHIEAILGNDFYDKHKTKVDEFIVQTEQLKSRVSLDELEALEKKIKNYTTVNDKKSNSSEDGEKEVSLPSEIRNRTNTAGKVIRTTYDDEGKKFQSITRSLDVESAMEMYYARKVLKNQMSQESCLGQELAESTLIMFQMRRRLDREKPDALNREHVRYRSEGRAFDRAADPAGYHQVGPEGYNERYETAVIPERKFEALAEVITDKARAIVDDKKSKNALDSGIKIEKQVEATRNEIIAEFNKRLAEQESEKGKDPSERKRILYLSETEVRSRDGITDKKVKAKPRIEVRNGSLTRKELRILEQVIFEKTAVMSGSTSKPVDENWPPME